MVSPALETFIADRVISGRKRGSSRPIVVLTSVGPRLVKLRGAAQGTGPLIAEIVVAELAAALGLHVPARCLIQLRSDAPTDDKDDELADLLRASEGLNLGFQWLDGARDAEPADLERVSVEEKAATLWLDRFVMNPDRTQRNPNILRGHGQTWLIDHGASLRFQYNWSAVTEYAPRAVGESYEPHVFEDSASGPGWVNHDDAFARAISREALEHALSLVPDALLHPMLPGTARLAASPPEALRRRRAAYVAFLWKRLKGPRLFATAPPQFVSAGTRGLVPSWVTAPR